MQKWYQYEEAVKVPLVFSCPNRIREHHRDTSHPVSTVDVMPTPCDFAGIPAPPHACGMSVRPFLEGKPASGHEFVAAEIRVNGRMCFAGDPVEQLFDMGEDPWEMNNLIDVPGPAGEIRAHRKLLDGWEASLDPAPKTSLT